MVSYRKKIHPVPSCLQQNRVEAELQVFFRHFNTLALTKDQTPFLSHVFLGQAGIIVIIQLCSLFSHVDFLVVEVLRNFHSLFSPWWTVYVYSYMAWVNSSGHTYLLSSHSWILFWCWTLPIIFSRSSCIFVLSVAEGREGLFRLQLSMKTLRIQSLPQDQHC